MAQAIDVPGRNLPVTVALDAAARPAEPDIRRSRKIEAESNSHYADEGAVQRSEFNGLFRYRPFADFLRI